MEKKIDKLGLRLAMALFLIFMSFSMTGCLTVLAHILTGGSSSSGYYDDDESSPSERPERTERDDDEGGSTRPNRTM